MPLTFIDIERQKNWRIALFFIVLLLVYLGVLAAFGLAILPVTLGTTTPRFWVVAGLLALLGAGIHFWFAAYDTVNNVIHSLDARPPDPDDEIHRMFSNIIDEVHVVTGNKRTIRCAVIPSLSLNALAAEDLKGNALIAITEGLLSRLTRPQIEAVACHEAHHILSGDCLETTVAASLFGTLSSTMEKIRYSSENRVFSLPAFFLAWILLQLGYLLNLFISREREYRADAASVRMTRNPLALAEALHLLSRSWRGAGFIGSGFEMLCIVNPQATAMDETEGFLPDLLSTHPPLKTRMEVLLAMARVSVAELDRKEARRNTGEQATGQRYFAMSPKQDWQGPFTLPELTALPWLTPLSWIVPEEGRTPDRAWKDPLVNTVFLQRLNGTEPAPNGFTCPACRQPLVTATYEGTRIYPCCFCAGTLVETDKIPRIIARTGRDRPCTERVTVLARAVLKENQSRMIYQKINGNSAGQPAHLSCPKCRNPLSRGFYSQAHLIEVDRCSSCGLTWFDKDELKMLQCMIEHRLVPDTADAAMSGARTEMTT
jgi:heat shock protein HtpX